jgi:hypothetical protein
VLMPQQFLEFRIMAQTDETQDKSRGSVQLAELSTLGDCFD